MFETLSQYLDHATTPEMKDCIKDALDSFTNMGIDSYEKEYDEILLLGNNVELSIPMDSIINLTKRYQTDILKEHAIVLQDETTIETATIFINALLKIQDYENKETLLKTASLDLNSNEILAEIVALITGKNSDELLINIADVSDSCISLIKELIKDKEDILTDEEHAVKQGYIDTFKRFCNYIGIRLQIDTLLREGLDVGFPFVIYANILDRDLEEFTVDKIAGELIGMAIISSDGSANPLSVIKENIERYISDIDKLTKVDIKVSQLLLGFIKGSQIE